MSKVELNKEVFDATVAKVVEANEQLQAGKFQTTISATNLKSIQQQVKAMKQLDEIITAYYQLLSNDVQILHQTAEQLTSLDHHLASSMKGKV